MPVRIQWLTVAFSLALFGACGGNGGTGPQIDEVTPSRASPGDSIEILGARFCGDESSSAMENGRCVTPPAAVVNFGDDAGVVRAAVSAYEQERITVTVPASAPAGATSIVLIRNGVASNPADFEVL